MSRVLFNINDLALILVISSSLIFIIILLGRSKGKRHHAWLVLFLSSVAITALNNILYWSPVIRLELKAIQPHGFILLRTALFCAPAALYTYTRSLIYEDFNFSLKNLGFFAPTILYVLFIPLIYFSMTSAEVAESALNYQALYKNHYFWFFTWLQHAVKVGCGLATLALLQHHKESFLDTSSDLTSIDSDWLKLLVVGFLSLWLTQAASQLCHQLHWVDTAQYLALFGNYFLFGLVNLLVVLSLTRRVATASTARAALETQASRDYTDEQVKRLASVMQEKQAFLKPDLTLEELSKLTSIPQRTLSAIINRHHHKNFFEYVNEHRVNRAAELLLDENIKLSVLEIMEEAGFNSKSAFNRFFKKNKGMTPTQYKSANNSR